MGFTPFLDRTPSLSAVNPARIARRLGLSVQTVKTRLRILERSGVLAGYQVYPNFRLLGLEVTSLHLRARDASRKRQALGSLRAMPGVWGVYDFQGTDVCLDLVAGDAYQLRALVAAAAHALGGAAHVFYDYKVPQVHIEFSPLDWRILAGLRRNARRPLPELARDLKVSVRTVRRHLNRMEKEGAVDAVAMFDPSRLDGAFPFLLMLHFDGQDVPAFRRTVLSLFKERWFAQWTPPDAANGHLVVHLLGRSARDIEDWRLEAESLPGVQHVDAMVFAGVTINEDWMDRAIEARAAPALVRLATAHPRAR